MKTLSILSTAAIGHMMITGALAAPPAGSGMVAPAQSDLVRVQAVQPSQAIQDRRARLSQHRSILQSALQPPHGAGPAEAPEPQARALQPPEPVVVTVPQDPAVAEEPASERQSQVTCEAAARIVADFGFSDIGRPDCSGDLYEFSAMRDGTAYAIAISPATGEITDVSRQ